jgi:hypothetical protein
MRARIISLIFGLVTILVALSFQVIAACSGIESDQANTVAASVIGFSGVRHNLMLKTTVASLVISLVSILVFLMDRYLDRQANEKINEH